MSKFRDLLQKVGIIRTVESPPITDTERNISEGSRPTREAEPTYTAVRDRDGVDDVYNIWNVPEDRVVCKIHFWDEPDTNEAAEALIDATALVADLNTGAISEAQARTLHPVPEWVDVEPREAPSRSTIDATESSTGAPAPRSGSMSEFRQFRDSVQFVRAVEQLKSSFAATQELISGWAIQRVQEAMVSGEIKGVPFAGLSRHDKLALLASAVNWERYTELGLDEQTPLRIMFNAVDGKAPEQWLHQTPDEASARRAELGGYFDAVRAARATMDHAADFERDLARSAARGKAEGKGRDRGPELE
ncbi:unnamed protein product [Gemmata massiliana]|uniref:Uncharacterized protein n=1 Tax=Gemmata massiliana TaxID=1210884 RepID=A0A6P2CRT3_9BACT|nr:hypothetical protein [Gemmata massiliana]VTR91643.1 unnamed protein product [Gemmata massiliana]